MLAVLTTSYVVTYLDRYLLSMAGHVEQEIGISDATMRSTGCPPADAPIRRGEIDQPSS